MTQRLTNGKPTEPALAGLLAYIAELELEVDRLRRHSDLVLQEVRLALTHVQPLRSRLAAADSPPPEFEELDSGVRQLTEALRDLRESPGYHPAHDQVVAIAVRPLAEQVFRWQQRLQGAPGVRLQLELESDHVEWFPARLRHILDNLLANALKYRDGDKAEAWVRLGLRLSAGAYELAVSDNGLGLEPAERHRIFDLFSRAAPARAAGLEVGLPVVKLLVEQSGGSVTVDSEPGQGTTFLVSLPRYDVADFLT